MADLATRDTVLRALRQFRADRASLAAAGMAFYWFLAVFPALLATTGVLGLTDLGPAAVDSLSDAIDRTLPADAAQVLTQTLSDPGPRPGHSVAAVAAGVAVGLWSASAGMAALQTGLSVVYRVPPRHYLRKRGQALLLALATLVLGSIATALIVFGRPLGEGIDHHLPFGRGVFVPLWTLARWAAGLGALTALFAVIYRFGAPPQAGRWRWLSPGGVVGAAIWLLASVGFSYYVTSFRTYGDHYGSLTGVVVLMLWLYLTALAVLFGGAVNAQADTGAAPREPEAQPAHAPPGRA